MNPSDLRRIRAKYSQCPDAPTCVECGSTMTIEHDSWYCDDAHKTMNAVYATKDEFTEALRHYWRTHLLVSHIEPDPDVMELCELFVVGKLLEHTPEWEVLRKEWGL